LFVCPVLEQCAVALKITNCLNPDFSTNLKNPRRWKYLGEKDEILVGGIYGSSGVVTDLQ
jgi:hypothetical protein